ncbi:MAG: hypothetical protein WA003_00020 [Desulfuromonadaceae bacterium]
MMIEDLEVKLNSRIMEAYASGMSVMEITKVLRKSRVDYVHGFLRDAGCIPTMDRSDYHRSFDVDNHLLVALRNKGYSFGRWCLGWKLDSRSAEADLKTKPLEGERTAAHQALFRDFPDIYTRLYVGRKVSRIGKVRAPRFYPTVAIYWDKSRKGYIANIVEHPEVAVVGFDLNDAFEKIMSANRLFQSIERLNDAIMKNAGE